MSTRRARIKAVTVLPPRRKITENVVKKTVASDKNTTNNSIESPKTPKRYAEDVTASSSPIKSANDKSALKVPSPALKSPQIETKKSVTPKIPSNLIVNSRQSPGFMTKDPIEKRTLFSPPPNLVVRNPNAGKSNEKDSANKKVCENVNKDNITPKSIQVSDCTNSSVSESITVEAMDGIVPLKPVSSGPKPIDLWKNEIISENAEVLFDPIVPLPSPSKVRPKVRPIPRLVPLRRSSIQGSASESEDESRRLLGASTPAHTRQRHDSQTSHSTINTTLNREVNRVRNDSMCSNMSQQPAHAHPPASPLKEKHISKLRRAEQARRAAALRRRRSPRPDTLTMYDLIFYNPTANPIVPDQDELKAKEANVKDALSENEPEAEVNANKEDVDDPPAADAPVPQIKIGPNGEIILDEKSLVIKQSHTGRKVSSSVVREGAWSGGGGRYSRSARTADWSAEETVRFYRALAAAGTDFSLMTPLFPNRSRRDLKLKFKKEERLNAAQIDKALRSASTWDIARLQEEFKEEREEAERQALKEKERLQKWKEVERTNRNATGGRHSKGAKAVLGNAKGTVSKSLTADDIIEHAKQIVKRRKQKDPQKVTSNSENSDKNKSSDHLSERTTVQSNNRPVTSTQVVPINLVAPNVPNNIEMGSLVVLTVNDPNTPSKKMLQTYISRGPGNLTPISLPPQLLNSVVNYMKMNDTTANGERTNTLSPAVEFATNVANSRNEPSPKRMRHSSFTITQL